MNEIQLLIEAIEDDINRDNGVLKDNFLLKTFVKGFEKVFTVKGDVARVRDVKGAEEWATHDIADLKTLSRLTVAGINQEFENKFLTSYKEEGKPCDVNMVHLVSGEKITNILLYDNEEGWSFTYYDMLPSSGPYSGEGMRYADLEAVDPKVTKIVKAGGNWYWINWSWREGIDLNRVFKIVNVTKHKNQTDIKI